MAGNVQQLIFDIIARDAASPAFAKLGGAAQGASGNVSDLSKRIDELGRKSAEARVGLAGDKEAQARLDRLDATLLTLTHRSANPNISIEGAARAAAEISALELELDKLGKKGGSADVARAAVGSGGGGLAGAGGMGALIGAGVVLSPILFTLGTGLAGFGAAAFGAVDPIVKAAQKTGGLQANMAKLNPEQKQLAQSLLGLGQQYHAFELALQPQVFSVFNQGLHLAGLLMHDVQPVAQSTGTAFSLFLKQFGATLQDPQWQGFWAFMAQTAPQDMRLLGQLIIDLTNDLPPLIQALQPAAEALLRLTDGAAKGLHALLDLKTGLQGWQDQQAKTAGSSNILAKAWGGLWELSAKVVTNLKDTGLTITGQYHPAVQKAAAGTQALGDSMQAISPQAKEYARLLAEANAQASKAPPLLQGYAHQLADVAVHTKDAGTQTSGTTVLLQGFAHQMGTAATASHNAVIPQMASAVSLAAIAKQAALAATAVTNLQTAQQNALATQVGYGSSLVTTANDAQALRDKLKLSWGMIGLQTQAQRDSFAAANTYITDLGNQAVAAFKSGHGVDASITAIRNGLPLLDSAKTKNKQYWQEVQTLVGWLDKLRAEKAISEAIVVTGTGSWHIVPGKIGLPGGMVGGAAGGMIRGGVPGRDSVPVLTMPGELIVPTSMVSAGLVDHLRGQLPGFAAGGVVGSYAGSPAGLGPWAQGEMNATASAVAASTAAATLAGIKGAIAGALAGAGAGGGVARWAGVVAQSLALSGARAPVSQVLFQIGTESGGNPRAINLTDINAQMGHPSKGLLQVIDPTFAMFANGLFSRGIWDPLANLFAAERYAMAVYGPTMMSGGSGLGSGHGYDAGGSLMPGVTLAVNRTGRPESVLGSRAEGLLEELIGAVQENTAILGGLLSRVPAATGAGLGAALGSAGRSSTYRALYS